MPVGKEYAQQNIKYGTEHTYTEQSIQYRTEHTYTEQSVQYRTEHTYTEQSIQYRTEHTYAEQIIQYRTEHTYAEQSIQYRTEHTYAEQSIQSCYISQPSLLLIYITFCRVQNSIFLRTIYLHLAMLVWRSSKVLFLFFRKEWSFFRLILQIIQ
jgi:hypothetical protein